MSLGRFNEYLVPRKTFPKAPRLMGFKILKSAMVGAREEVDMAEGRSLEAPRAGFKDTGSAVFMLQVLSDILTAAEKERTLTTLQSVTHSNDRSIGPREVIREELIRNSQFPIASCFRSLSFLVPRSAHKCIPSLSPSA